MDFSPYRNKSLKAGIESCYSPPSYTLECLINVPVRVFISRKMPPYTGLIWHQKKKYIFLFLTFKYISLHILATQFLRNTTNSPDLVVNKSWYLYNLSLGRLLEGDPLKCCLLIQAAGTGSYCAATLHTICEICHPILLFGTILLLNLCDLPPYTLIWHYMFIRHTRVVLDKIVTISHMFGLFTPNHRVLNFVTRVTNVTRVTK